MSSTFFSLLPPAIHIGQSLLGVAGSSGNLTQREFRPTRLAKDLIPLSRLPRRHSSSEVGIARQFQDQRRAGKCMTPCASRVAYGVPHNIAKQRFGVRQPCCRTPHRPARLYILRGSIIRRYSFSQRLAKCVKWLEMTVHGTFRSVCIITTVDQGVSRGVRDRFC
jgi:hypothetical protein